MIFCRVPVRVSYFGGGSDFPDFYREQEGAVVSGAINQFVYLIVKKKFDRLIRLSYSTTEIVDHPATLKHDLAREALCFLNINHSIEIASVSDLPGCGSGLGSSSAYLVGLLQALHQYLGNTAPPEQLAREACHIERNILGKPIGVQDQYIAALGGLRFLHFHGTTIRHEPISCKLATLEQLSQNTLLVYTGQGRHAETVLQEQHKRLDGNRAALGELVHLAKQFKANLAQDRLDGTGKMLHAAWEIKRKLASQISNPFIDHCYQVARQHGAEGGKIGGAGGGGFLMFYAAPDAQVAIREALALPAVNFRFEPEGSKIIYSCST